MSSFQIRIDERVASVVEQLAGIDPGDMPRDNRVARVFPSMAEALVFASLIGFKSGRREPLASTRKNPISSQIFDSAQIQGYVFLLAVAHSEDVNALRDEKLQEAVRVFEEYANGGFFELQDYLKESGLSLFDAVLSLMTSEAAKLVKEGARQVAPPVIIKGKKKKLISPT